MGSTYQWSVDPDFGGGNTTGGCGWEGGIAISSG